MGVADEEHFGLRILQDAWGHNGAQVLIARGATHGRFQLMDISWDFGHGCTLQHGIAVCRQAIVASLGTPCKALYELSFAVLPG